MIRSASNDVKSPFWRAFSSLFLPNATTEQFKWFSDLHSTALTLESGIASRIAVDQIYFQGRFSSITAPTLVLHSLRDQLVPFEQGRPIATSIPNAKLVPLDSENHTLLASNLPGKHSSTKLKYFCRAVTRPEPERRLCAMNGHRVGLNRTADFSTKRQGFLRPCGD